MAKLEIAGRKADLVLDMASWEDMEENVGRLDEIDDLMESRQRLRNIRSLAAILSAEGARLGRGEEMPADWLRENMMPAQVRLVTGAIRAAIMDGMRMETTKGESEVVDATLAELEKKEMKDA